ncbi:hypothetical protein PPL_12132 [Heterostelium album PN500]|uniref:Solute carrier family 66 member 2 n=1 Tax=Heterostelium pallidum (strain ATCC 26659 / Pp 5 / PN500) TaxID=670386 RepID=D3BLS8_HETP5|nr:hypothetical protein PPL_12132 [Heterostelium album PN500]EFA77529.1 hypothetical protein PPL_12132 [Heterostelium album PN500]|eukprot:XP_020429657.1 hypothetical protein PPL_12132 [Heterostelium album PN500]
MKISKDTLLESLKIISSGEMVFSLIMVFGPVIGYVSQYKSMKETRNAEAFSSKVSLILLLSNILRCYFWIGERFETTLLYQALVMIVAQLLMLQLTVSLKASDSISRSRRSLSQSFTAQPFWEWDSLSPYLMFLAGYSGLFMLLTMMFYGSSSFFDLLGTLSLTIEAMLGVPQLYQNYKNGSAKGLSFVLIGSWFLGDLFKTLYFFYNNSPNQFIYCGLFQLFVDVAISYQILTYK